MSENSPQQAAPGAEPSRQNIFSRRGVLLGIAGFFASVVGILVMLLLLPSRVRRVATELQPVIRFDELPADGSPRSVAVNVDDPKSFLPKTTYAGTVLLARKPGEAVPVCLSGNCPHAGCVVEYVAAANEFHCPCHDSRFATDGALVAGPAKTGLATVECRVEADQVWVRLKQA